MTDCKPPPGTKPGTLCALRKDKLECVGVWNGRAYLFARPSNGYPSGTEHELHESGAWKPNHTCTCGWRYAGVCSELPELPDLPDVMPQTAQEIAREAMHSVMRKTGHVSASDPQMLFAVLRRISELPE